MKFLYVALIVVLIGGGYYGFTQYSKSNQEKGVIVPEGSHMMSDGTLMPNTAETGDMEKESDSTKEIEAVKDASQSTVTLDPNARVFSIKGVNYGYDVQEIRVKQGDTVTLNFESTDGFHDVVIDEFAVATKRVQPGTKTSATFVADKVGTYEYYCSVGQHRSSGMVGKLIVE